MRLILLSFLAMFSLMASAEAITVNVQSGPVEEDEIEDLTYVITFSGTNPEGMEIYDDKPIYAYNDIQTAAKHSKLNTALAAIDASYDLTVEGSTGWKNITELKIVGQINYSDAIILRWLTDKNTLQYGKGAGGSTGGQLKKVDLSETTFAIETIKYLALIYNNEPGDKWPKHKASYGFYDDGEHRQTDPAEIPGGLFVHVTMIEEVILNPDCPIIEDDAFAFTTGLKKVYFPEGSPSKVNYISWAAFNGSSIEYFDFEQCPELEIIGRSAFQDCKQLKTADFTKCPLLKEIWEYAFYNCESLKEIDCSKCPELKEVKTWAFAYTTAMENISFNGCSDLEYIRAYAFFHSGVSEMDFTNCSSLSYIGTLAICYTNLEILDISPCSSLATLSIGAISLNDHLTYINASGCVSLSSTSQASLMNFPLERVDFPESLAEGVELICQGSLFYRCVSLKEIAFPEGTKDLGKAMEGCKTLETVYLPESLENVGGACFNQCPALRTIYCKNATVPTNNPAIMAGNTEWKDLFTSWATTPVKDDEENVIAPSDPKKIVVYVPENALDNYKVDVNNNWNQCIVAEPKKVGWEYSTYCRANNQVTSMVPDGERESWSYPESGFLKAYKITGYQPYTGENAPSDVDYEVVAQLLDNEFEPTNGVMFVTDNTAGDYYLYSRPEATKNLASMEGNQLVGVTEYTTNIPQRANGKVNFFLGDDAFYLVKKTGNYLPAGRAYLSLDEAILEKGSQESKRMLLTFIDEQTSSIRTTGTVSNDDNTWFTLQGTHVTTPTKGIYVKNGKKIVIK